MPPRAQPKTYILLLKTHKLTVFLTAPITATIESLKAEALTALQSSVIDAKLSNPDGMDVDEEPVPKVGGVKDFELSKSIRERGRPTGRYEVLNPEAIVQSVLVNWEPVFVQFKDENGQLLPVKVVMPSLFDEEDEAEIAAARKGKRKAAPESA